MVEDMFKENSLQSYVDSFFDNLTLYDDYKYDHRYKSILKASIDVFLDNKTQFNAFGVYEIFLMIYQITPEDKFSSNDNSGIVSHPNIPLDFANLMKRYEENSSGLGMGSDFLIRSVNVFILGLAIYSQNKNYKNYFKDYVIGTPYKNYYKNSQGEFSDEEFLYRWGIASLFYDIALPIEFMAKPRKKLLNNEINSILNAYGEDLQINLLDFPELDSITKIDYSFSDNYRNEYPTANFLNLFKPTQVIFHRLALDFDLDARTLHLLENKLKDILENVTFNHGLISSVLILKIYGYILQNYDKNPDFFFYPIVDSAIAIFLHNIYRNLLQGDPFNLGQLRPSQNPIAFLLILCDIIQPHYQTSAINNKNSLENDLKIEIDSDSLYVKYIVRNAFPGFIYYEDIKTLIDMTLSIDDIFIMGLAISADVELQNNIDFGEIIKNDISFRNVEILASQLHQEYNNKIKMEYEKELTNGSLNDTIKAEYESLCSFDELPSDIKISYIRQVKSIPKKLNRIGYEIAGLSDERVAINSFSPKEIEEIAILEHEHWCEEKTARGWTYGPIRDNDKLIHNCLVPWEKLDPSIQQYDLDAAANIPRIIDSVGLKIVFSKIKLLAVEMYKYYLDGKGVSQKDGGSFSYFMQLPEDIRNSYYKKAVFMVRLLFNLSYELRDIEDSGMPVNRLQDEIAEYLAKREHEEWYKEKINIGWKYGPIKDDFKKISPNLVPWYDLDRIIKKSNIELVMHLPEMCENVGLKIVERQ